MSKSDYRMCLLDNTGRIIFSRIAPFADDLAALTEAQMDCADHPIEVWQNSRLVARVKANNAPLDVTDRTCL